MKLSGHHIVNVSYTTDQIVSALGIWHLDEDFKKRLETILKDEEKLRKLHRDISSLNGAVSKLLNAELV